MITSLTYKMAALLTENDINVPKTDLGDSVIQNGLQIFFGIAGAVALLIITIGAFKYVISAGDANAVKNAKETILYAVIGLIVTMTGYGIVTFVIGNI